MRFAFIATVLALALAASPGSAQSAEEESALGTQLSGYGGFIGMDMRFGDMMDEFAVFMGGHAALLLKHRVYLGLSGAAVVTDASRAFAPGGALRPAIDMSYGGVLVGYIIPTPGLVQLTADVLIGGGGVKLREHAGTTDDDDWDALFVFEPALSAEIKLARIVRLGLGAGYRFVGAVDAAGLGDQDLRGFNGTVTFRVGWF